MKSVTHHSPSIRFLNRLFAVVLSAVVLVWTGCDGTEEEETEDDTPRFVGTWDAVSLAAGPLNVLGDMTLVATFGAGGSVQIVVSDPSGELANVSGQYDVDTPAGEVTLSGNEFDEDLNMDYEFVSDDELKLSFSGSDLQNLGIDLGEFGGIVGSLRLTATLEKRP
ncbi:MAG TPA: hypothetical protein VMO47_14035 [Rhodothermales bacterium]|nr:hypothetical protein [Rhodothermales bacterium]